MKLIKQPKGSKLCGQSSVAMILGIDLEKSVELFGHKKATYFHEYTKILNKFNIDTTTYQRVDNRKSYNLPRLSIIRIERVGKRMGHIVIHNNGKFYDPSRGVFDSKEDLINSYNMSSRGRWRVRGYMEVLKNKEMAKAQ